VQALQQLGLPEPHIELLGHGTFAERASRLLPRFDGARQVIEQLRQQRLRDVGGKFVWPHVRVQGQDESRSACEALDEWLASSEQTALLLGEFGTGKSTLLAQWAVRRWDEQPAMSRRILQTGVHGWDEFPAQSRPVLCSLSGAGPSADAEALLLQASGIRDTLANRAALLLSIRRHQLLPIFDGFDEMATRLTPADLAGRLAELLRVARGGGQVVVSSRDHYFPTEDQLRTATEQALADALGRSSGCAASRYCPSTKTKFVNL
jgi:hypothetical protein